MKKIMSIFAISLVMILGLAGCGGGDSGAGTQETAAKPNAGLREVVYAIPDGWTLTDTSSESFADYENPDAEYDLIVSALTGDDLSSLGDSSVKTVQEYFDKYLKATEEHIDKYGLEQETITICGSDAFYTKRKNGDKGYVTVDAVWVYNDVLYDIQLFNRNIFDEEGQLKEDAAELSDEDIAMFDGVIASITPGDPSEFTDSGEE